MGDAVSLAPAGASEPVAQPRLLVNRASARGCPSKSIEIVRVRVTGIIRDADCSQTMPNCTWPVFSISMKSDFVTFVTLRSTSRPPRIPMWSIGGRCSTLRTLALYRQSMSDHRDKLDPGGPSHIVHLPSGSTAGSRLVPGSDRRRGLGARRAAGGVGPARPSEQRMP